jgi:hypothetical protein
MPANQPVNHQTSASVENRGFTSDDSEKGSSTNAADRTSTAQDGNCTRKQTGNEEARSYEFIDCRELARRWDVPVSWIRDQVRRRAEDPLPHVNLGKYVRFLWGSPELLAWIERRIVMGNNRRVGRVH